MCIYSYGMRQGVSEWLKIHHCSFVPSAFQDCMRIRGVIVSVEKLSVVGSEPLVRKLRTTYVLVISCMFCAHNYGFLSQTL